MTDYCTLDPKAASRAPSVRANLLVLGILLALIVLPSAAPAQSPDIDQLMRRVGTYVQGFVETFSNVVADERYEQRLAGRRRQLTSDFLLAAYPGSADRVLTFRDVREVDGQPVTDQSDRITKLFLNPFESAIGRATEIQLAGLSHGLSGGRLVDPLGILAILQPEYQGDFRFTRQGLDRTLGSDIRRIDLIRFRPIRTNQPRGSVWVSETTGEVVRTQSRIDGARSERTTTTFEVDRELRIRVPVEMEDEIGDFRGRATYSNFRRFTVRTESTIDATGSTPR
jgi:hypothetical protein